MVHLAQSSLNLEEFACFARHEVLHTVAFPFAQAKCHRIHSELPSDQLSIDTVAAAIGNVLIFICGA